MYRRWTGVILSLDLRNTDIVRPLVRLGYLSGKIMFDKSCSPC
jgi:hypothetical protein